MPYNVFTDFHHASLLNSLIMLFEGRLGGNLYRPIGMEWAERGYWKVYDHPATQAQFLGIGGATPDGTRKLNEVAKKEIMGDFSELYYCHDIESETTNKAITLEAFFQLPIDIVIASIPAHVEPFKRLCAEHPNHPKLIFQIGNAWTIEAALAPNIMASAIINYVPEDVHFISYHQEFDTKIFNPGYYEFMDRHSIYSFVNCFNVSNHFADDWKLFEQMEIQLQNWDCKSFGGQCRDGSCDGSQSLANKMREAMFIWHTKNGGDGYGHVIHNAAAVGRPLIVKKSQYAGKMADQLLTDGETCINIDNLSIEEIKNKILFFSDLDKYVPMCQKTVENFKKVCDFDAEFIKLRDWLENLV